MQTTGHDDYFKIKFVSFRKREGREFCFHSSHFNLKLTPGNSFVLEFGVNINEENPDYSYWKNKDHFKLAL